MNQIAEQLDEKLRTLDPVRARSLESRVRQAIVRDESGNDLRREFEALRDEWKAQSEFLSSTTDMALLWPYQSIIGMGADVVPFILEELSRETDHWFWALKAITKVDPVPPEHRGNVRAMAAAWLRWGREQGLIDDVANN
jgi:hypothetical protein